MPSKVVRSQPVPALRPLSAETVRQAVLRRDPMKDVAARFGPVVAKKLHGVFNKTRDVDAPLVQTLIDHTQLDVHAGYEDINEFGEITWAYAGRPWLTRLSDLHTRCVLGMALSFQAPSFEEVVAAIRHAVLPKTYTRAWVESGHLVQEWEAMGLMHELYADNALELTGTAYMVALEANGISMVTAPPNIPYSKAQAERAFGALNQAIHRLSGTTFGRSNLRHLSYDGRTYACHDIAWLWKALHIINEDIELDWHDGIQDQPRRRFREGVRRFPVCLPLDLEQFQADLSIHSSRTIQRSGIQYRGLFYTGRQLEDMKRQNPHVRTYAIRIDPEDLNFIRVIDPQTGRPVRVACTEAAARPRPLREHILTQRARKADEEEVREANAGPSAQRSAYLQETDHAALTRQAGLKNAAQAALRAASRQPPPLEPPPDAAAAAQHRAQQLLDASRGRRRTEEDDDDDGAA